MNGPKGVAKTMRTYGIGNVTDIADETRLHVESVRNRGFSIVEAVLDRVDVDDLSTRLDRVYQSQVEEFPADDLSRINEKDVVRCPLGYDRSFVALASNKRIRSIIEDMLGPYYILHLQNGVISRSGQEHHQSAWHRDLPYQDFVSSQPLALSVFYCLSDFSEATGGTILLPFSHKFDQFPSRQYVHQNQWQCVAPSGSAILFDSMLYHRAGYNRSKITRRGINHVYAVGIVRQQIDIPNMLGDIVPGDAYPRMLLGFQGKTAKTVKDWRIERFQRLDDDLPLGRTDGDA